jgi:hypothetical protein
MGPSLRLETALLWPFDGRVELVGRGILGSASLERPYGLPLVAFVTMFVALSVVAQAAEPV